MGKTSGKSRKVNSRGRQSMGNISVINAKDNHINDTDLIAFLNNFCIIDRTNNELDLLIHESLLIFRDRATLNV